MDDARLKIFEKYLHIILSGNLPSDETAYKRKDLKLEEIIFIIQNLSDFICESSTDISRGQIIVRLAELIAGFGMVYKVESEFKDFGPEDFSYVAANAVECFYCLGQLLSEVPELDQSQKRQFYINALLLCGTHSENNLWCSDSSIGICKEFQCNLLKCSQYKDLTSLLVDDSFFPTIIKGALKKMRPTLLKDMWQFYPSSCYIFHYLLLNVNHPFLVDYLPDVLPPAFMFTSHFKPAQKVIGLQCFYHILDNVPQSLIMLDGKDEAICHSLFPLTYSEEPDIVNELYPCLLKLSKMKPQKTQSVVWEDYDKVFNNLLFTMAMEYRVPLKRSCLSQVLAFCEHAPPFKHLKRLMTVIQDTVSNEILQDAVCIITALMILRSVIKSCWIRMPNYCFKVLAFVLELQENITNLQNSSPSTEKELEELSKECILLLKFSCNEKFETLTKSYIEDDPNLPGVEFLRNILIENR